MNQNFATILRLQLKYSFEFADLKDYVGVENHESLVAREQNKKQFLFLLMDARRRLKERTPVDTKVINVYGKETVEIICPHCWKIGAVSTSRMPTPGKEHNLKCQCGKTSIVIFDKRRNPRKNVGLLGVVQLNDKEYLVNVLDLSLSGCSFIFNDDRSRLKFGDNIVIRFKLDHRDSELIECFAVVRNAGMRLGVEFVDMTYRVKTILGSYFT